jgi:hypothetical protein
VSGGPPTGVVPEAGAGRGTPRGASHWFWGGFFVVLIVGLVLAGVAGLRAGSQWLQERLWQTSLPVPVRAAVKVTLAGGEALYLDPDQLARLRAEMHRDLDVLREALAQRVRDASTRAVATAFAPAYDRVPDFADWYYSLAGEYGRLWHALAGGLADYLEGRLAERVIGPSGLAQRLDELPAELAGLASDEARALAATFEGRLVERLRALAGEPRSVQVEVSGEWDVAGVAAEVGQAVALGPADFARQAAATSAGAATGAVLAKKLGAATVAKTGAKLAGSAAKVGLKSAAKAGVGAGSAASGAAAGAALCTATVAGAPLAPACALLGGVATGVATWVLVDEAVLATDEYFNRAEFEEALRHSLAESQAELAEMIAAQQLRVLESVLDRLASGLDAVVQPVPAPPKDFVPAQAAGGR